MNDREKEKNTQISNVNYVRCKIPVTMMSQVILTNLGNI